MNKLILETKNVELIVDKNIYTIDHKQNKYESKIELSVKPYLFCSNALGFIETIHHVTVTRYARIINSNLIEIDEDFKCSLNLNNVYNLEYKDLYKFFNDISLDSLKKFIENQKKLVTEVKLENSEEINTEQEEIEEVKNTSNLKEPCDDEIEFFNKVSNNARLNYIKAHAQKFLTENYPNGLILSDGENNEKEYNYYCCLVDFIEKGDTLTDIMNIASKYDVELYHQTFKGSGYRVMETLYAKFNALILNLMIIKKYYGKYGYLKSETKLTGKTLEYYMTGYMSAYNKNTIRRINVALGGHYLTY